MQAELLPLGKLQHIFACIFFLFIHDLSWWIMLKWSILRRSSNVTVLFSFPDLILKLSLYGLWKWWIHRERSASSPAFILITTTSSSLRMIRLYEAPALSVSSTFTRRTCKLTLWPSCEPHFCFLAARISYMPDVVCSPLFCHICVSIASSILALVGWVFRSNVFGQPHGFYDSNFHIFH